MVSSEVRDAWQSLEYVDWSSATGNRTALIARVGAGPFIAHVRTVDEMTAKVLRLRPEGLETPIHLYSLRASDDVSVLDSDTLVVAGGTPIDLEPLYGLSSTVRNLVMLGVAISNGQRLRLGDLQHVESLAADWIALDLTAGYGSSLRDLAIDRYRGKDGTDLLAAGCEHVESLSILRGTGMQSLSGLQAFSELKRLTLYGCSRLSDFTSLPQLRSVRHLFIEGCRKLQSLEGILPTTLETLAITDCGPIRSIGALTRCPTLRRVALDGDTFIEDLDLTPLMRLPALRSVLISPRRGYDPTAHELGERFVWEPLGQA